MTDVSDIHDAVAADAGETVVSGIIEASTLQQYVDTLAALVNECKMHFGDHGVRVSAVEPGNVAMYQNTELAPRAFEAFDAPGQVTVGINLVRLDELLDPANSGDLVAFAVDMETRTLLLRFRNISQSMALIDPEAIRKEPDGTDINPPNTLTITGRQLDDVVAVADATSDHVAIEAVPDDREVRFVAEGDVDDSVVAFGDDEAGDPTTVDEIAESLYSIAYVESLAKPVPDDAAVTVYFGDDFPCRIKYDAIDGALDVHAMIAPRI